MLYPTLPFGAIAYGAIFYTMFWIVIVLVIIRRSKGGGAIPEGVKRIIASTGDVSAGIVGTRKVQFVRNPQDALVFLKIEENAVQQALTAVDYYVKQGEIEESLKDKLVNLYQERLQALQKAISSSAELREVIDSSTAVDKARSDYLRKLEAMSGTAVEADSSEAGPSSVGMPDSLPAEAAPTPTTGPPGGAAPSGGPPSGGPPSGAAPGGGPPSGAAPSGGPPGGAAPSGGPPGGGPPGGAAPSGGPPGGSPPGDAAPSSSPPGGAPGGAPSGPPGGAPDSGGPPGGAAAPSTGGGKSTLQSEMLAEMERLRALMSGD